MVKSWIIEEVSGDKNRTQQPQRPSSELAWMLDEILGLRGKIASLSETAARTAGERNPLGVEREPVEENQALIAERDRLSAELSNLRREYDAVRRQTGPVAPAIDEGSRIRDEPSSPPPAAEPLEPQPLAPPVPLFTDESAELGGNAAPARVDKSDRPGPKDEFDLMKEFCRDPRI